MRQDRGEMSGRICLITGATSGIGLVTARELAARGATVAIVGRNETKTRAAVEAIRQRTGNTEVDYLLADLSSQDAVRGMADAFQRRYGALHVLVNNAGAVFMRRQETTDGLELTFALNHLAPFLLSNLLLDTLRANTPARVVTVEAMAINGVYMPNNDIQDRKGRYSAFGIYGHTNIDNIPYTYALARRLAGSGVTANTLHPGFVASNIARNYGPVMNVAMSLGR